MHWGVAMVGVACVVIATTALVFAYLTTDDLNDRLTPLEQAPCRLNPGGEQCSKLIDGFIQTITPEQAWELEEKARSHGRSLSGE